jgi:hypothetical protein
MSTESTMWRISPAVCQEAVADGESGLDQGEENMRAGEDGTCRSAS